MAIISDIPEKINTFLSSNTETIGLLNLLINKGLDSDTYKMRNELLVKCFNKNLTTTKTNNGCIVFDLNCFDSPNTSLRYFLPKTINSSFICPNNCTQKSIEHFYLPIDYNKLSNSTLYNISNIIDFEFNDCQKCGQHLKHNIEFPLNFFMVEVEPLEPNIVYKIKPNDVQECLEIGGFCYELRGIINRRGEHYTGIVKRNTLKWEEYDDIKNSVQNAPSFINPNVLFYFKKMSEN